MAIFARARSTQVGSPQAAPGLPGNTGQTGGQIGAMFGEVGAALEQARRRTEARHDATNLARAQSAARLSGEEMYYDWEATQDISDPNAITPFAESLAAKHEEILSNFQGSEDARTRLRVHLETTRGQLLASASSASVQAGRKVVEDHLGDTLARAASTAARTPAALPALLGDFMEQVSTYADVLPEGQSRALIRNGASVMVETSLEAMLTQPGGADQVRALLENNRSIDGALDPKARLRLMRQVQTMTQAQMRARSEQTASEAASQPTGFYERYGVGSTETERQLSSMAALEDGLRALRTGEMGPDTPVVTDRALRFMRHHINEFTTPRRDPETGEMVRRELPAGLQEELRLLEESGGTIPAPMTPYERAANVSGVTPEFLQYLVGVESGGRNIGTQIVDASGQPASSAFGPMQFTTGTWRDMIGRYPQLGMTMMDRFDPEAQVTMGALYAADNAEFLERTLGREPTGGDIRLAHLFGPGGAAALLAAEEGATVDQALAAAVSDPGRRARILRNHKINPNQSVSSVIGRFTQGAPQDWRMPGLKVPAPGETPTGAEPAGEQGAPEAGQDGMTPEQMEAAQARNRETLAAGTQASPRVLDEQGAQEVPTRGAEPVEISPEAAQTLQPEIQLPEGDARQANATRQQGPISTEGLALQPGAPTLFELAAGGAVNATGALVRLVAGNQPFFDFGNREIAAGVLANEVQELLTRARQLSPRYAEAERQQIREDIQLEPRVFQTNASMMTRLLEMDKLLQRRIEFADKVLSGEVEETFPEMRNQARQQKAALEQVRGYLLPEHTYENPNDPAIDALPTGTMVYVKRADGSWQWARVKGGE